MSKYQEEFQAHFTGLRGYKLYAHGTFYHKDIEYNPIKKEILVGPTDGFGRNDENWFREIQKFGIESQIIFKTIRELYSSYELSDLAQHPAVVIPPYTEMSYSIIEFYLSNIPIFVSSFEILKKSKSLSVNFDDENCGNFESLSNSTIDYM